MGRETQPPACCLTLMESKPRLQSPYTTIVNAGLSDAEKPSESFHLGDRHTSGHAMLYVELGCRTHLLDCKL